MPQKRRLVYRKFAVPILGGATHGQVLEYADQTTAAEDAEVAEYFRLDRERMRPGWNWLRDVPAAAGK